ncbi:MAG TPA: DinB family protein [Fimbriimonas sp.]
MDVKRELAAQFRAGLAMLSDCVEKCPDDLWTSPSPRIDEGDRIIYRSFWRIAYHAVYFTHLYLGQGEDAFAPWPGRRPAWYEEMWHKPWALEPFEFPEAAEPPARNEVLEYIAYLDAQVGPILDSLDLESSDSGFPWYPNHSKLAHELLNLRHLQGHVGQLSEILLAKEIETRWISR